MSDGEQRTTTAIIKKLGSSHGAPRKAQAQEKSDGKDVV